MAKSSLESQIQAFRKKFNSAAASRKKQIMALRVKAADAALHWVMSHKSRVNQFKDAVEGTPVAGAVDKLIHLLEVEAKPAKKAAPQKAAKKATKKTATKAAKKPARRAAKRAAPAATPPSA